MRLCQERHKRTNVTLDNLIAQRQAVPMLVVMPLGYGGSGAALMELAAFERALLDEIIPRVEKSYRVSRARIGRAIVGVSMGGSQAMAIGLRHASAFGWIGSMSGQLQSDELQLPGDPNQFALIYLGWGASDPLAPRFRQFAERLNDRGAAVTTSETPDLGHVWTLWRQMAADVIRQLFKSPSR